VDEEALHCAMDRLQALVARPANCSAAASVKGAAVEALGCVAAALVDCGAQVTLAHMLFSLFAYKRPRWEFHDSTAFHAII
jgi:hypothetical protein